MIYFKNVDGCGDLIFEKDLFTFDKIPMIFVCRDMAGRYFFCECVDAIENWSWMITRTSRELLVKVMRDEISVLDVFKHSGHEIILADQAAGGMQYRTTAFADIPAEELPDEDEKLENPALESYIGALMAEGNRRELRFALPDLYFVDSLRGFRRHGGYSYAVKDASEPLSLKVYWSPKAAAADEWQQSGPTASFRLGNCVVTAGAGNRNYLENCAKRYVFKCEEVLG